MNENNITTRKYSDAAEGMSKKPKWNGKEKKAANGTPYGKKIYDIRIPEQRKSAVREIMVRKNLVAKRKSCVTGLVGIKPKELAEFLNKMDNDKIRDNFFNSVKELEKFLDKMEGHTITLQIEMGQTSVAEDMSRLANKFNEIDAIKLIKNIFEQIDEIHSENVLHLDIKPDNMVWSKYGKRIVLLNDFDTSVVLRPLEESHYDNEPSITLRYAAPEQLGLYNCELSKKTDIFSASLIAFQICSEGKIPERLNKIKNNRSLSKDEYIDKLRETFNDISVLQENGEDSWELPKHGSDKLKKIILSGLNVNPDKRPSAAEIIKELDKIVDMEKMNMRNENKNVTYIDNRRYENCNIDKSKNIGGNNYENINAKEGAFIGPYDKTGEKQEGGINIKVIAEKIFIIFIFILIAVIIFFALNSIFDLFNKVNDTDSNSIYSIQTTLSSEETDIVPIESLTTATINSLTYTEPITTTIATEEKCTESSGNNNKNSVNVIDANTNGGGVINIQVGDKTDVKNNVTNHIYKDKEDTNKTNETNPPDTTEPPVTETVETNPPLENFTQQITGVEDGFAYTIEDEHIVITSYQGSEVDIVIPEYLAGYPVGAIGEEAFAYTNIKTVEILGNNVNDRITGVQRIGEKAFHGCSDLLEVTLASSVKYIGPNAFTRNNDSADINIYFNRSNI